MYLNFYYLISGYNIHLKLFLKTYNNLLSSMFVPLKSNFSITGLEAMLTYLARTESICRLGFNDMSHSFSEEDH